MKLFGNKDEIKYYQLDGILIKNADYNIIFGERSNGKTYAALLYGLQNYVEKGEQFAYIRRWREDLRGKRAESLFANHTANGLITKITKGKFNEVFTIGGKYFLAKYDKDKNKRVLDSQPFCFGFALSEQEHEKSSSYPLVKTIIFDEFLTRRVYLPDEFLLFMNLLSTIIRQRNDVKIFMLGNTTNKYCPYFTEMGLTNVTRMQQGTIDVYQFGKDGALVAVEYCSNIVKNKASNKYFCFDNQNLQMITGGKWELAIYPHLPRKYLPKNVLFVFYVVFNETILQGNIIQVENDIFLYFHKKTTPIKETPNTLIYTLENSSAPNKKRRILSNNTDLDKKIANFFVTDKVFYQDNEIGEILRNYILVSQQSNIKN